MGGQRALRFKSEKDLPRPAPLLPLEYVAMRIIILLVEYVDMVLTK